MFKAMCFVSLAFAAAASHATCTQGGYHHGSCSATNGANSPSQSQNQTQYARSHSVSTSASNATSNATGGDASSQSVAMGGTGGASTSNASGGDGGNVAYNANQVRQTPPAFAGTVQPTASCKNAINGGASAPIAGISFGVGKTDKECDLRETARMFYELGERTLAVELLCTSDAAKRLQACAPTVAPPAPVVVTVPTPGTYSQAQVDAIVRKAVSK